jgi:hypothetical protein
LYLSAIAHARKIHEENYGKESGNLSERKGSNLSERYRSDTHGGVVGGFGINYLLQKYIFALKYEAAMHEHDHFVSPDSYTMTGSILAGKVLYK